MPNLDQVPEYLRSAGMKKNHRQGWFKCHCGNEFKARVSHIKSGHYKSCGCMRGKVRFNRVYAPGTAEGHRHENRWKMMNQRCLNPSNDKYEHYGARGIEVYRPWQTNFLEYAEYIDSLPNANKAGLTVDRINNNGNYAPGNLRWADAQDQINNSRRW